MKSKNNESTRITLFINDKNVLSILEQLPKGVKGMFVEQAILNYSSKNPRIEFFFQGITKTKNATKAKDREKDSENTLKEKAQKEDNNPQAHANEDESEPTKKNGGMMFNFGKKG